MNHNHRKPYIPLPPALPRFSLPQEEGVDPADVAKTAQRPALTSGSRRVVRRVRPVRPDATEEVAVEDILLEVYAEDPPPPPSRRPAVLTPPQSASIAAAIASVVPSPPPPAQSAAVDALLRASDPAFAPVPHYPSVPPQGQGYVHVGYMDPRVGADFETPSVAPVMLATTQPPAPAGRPIVGARRTSRGAVFAIWSAVVLVLAVLSGGGIYYGMRDGFFARTAARFQKKPKEPAVVAAAAPPPATSAPAPTPPPPPVAEAPAPAPASVSVDSLPKSPIPSDTSLVTFPSYAQGHRVFVDGRVVVVADGAPTKMKCGRHMMKIGSARKARVVDLACGREVIIQ